MESLKTVNTPSARPGQTSPHIPEDRSQEPKSPPDAPQDAEEPTLSEGQRAAQKFDAGPSMALLREKIEELPYESRLAAVLLKELFITECQTGFHAGINGLMHELREDVLAHQPADPQAKGLQDLLRTIQLIQQAPGQEQWRSAVDLWARTVPKAGAQDQEVQEARQGEEGPETVAEPEAVVNLMRSIETPCFRWMQDMLSIVQDVLPDLTADEAGNENVVRCAILKSAAFLDGVTPKAVKNVDFTVRYWSMTIKRALTALEETDARHQALVVQAAIDRAHDLQAKTEMLTDAHDEIARIYRGLDAKTLALLKVRSELFDWGPEYDDRFCHVCDQFDSIDVDATLGNTEYAHLIPLYHFAEEICESA